MTDRDGDRDALLGAVACTCCSSADMSAIVIDLEAHRDAAEAAPLRLAGTAGGPGAPPAVEKGGASKGERS